MPYEIRQGDIPGIQLRCEHRFAVAPAELWRWVTEPDRMGRWLADDIEVDGEGMRLVSGAEDGSVVTERGRTLAFEDGLLWVMAFERLDEGWESATELRLELSPDDPCRLTVLQRGFERLSLSRCLSVWELYRRRWREALGRLAAVLDSASG